VHLVLYAIPFFYLVIAIEAIAAKILRRRVYDLADTITNLNLGLLVEISGLAMKILYFDLYAFVFTNTENWHFVGSGLHVWIIAFLTFDFIYYWVHRVQHRVSLFWAMHVVHHSSQYYNLSVNLRGSISPNFTHWLFYIPLAISGIPPFIFLAVLLANALLRYWAHTELIGKLGWLDYVIITPSNHGVHHGQNDYCLDKNFGGVFMFWDHLFGTFAAARDDEPVQYGVRHARQTYNPIVNNLHVYSDVHRFSQREKSWLGKLKCWLQPPGDVIDVVQNDLASSRSRSRIHLSPAAWMSAAVLGHVTVLACTVSLLLLDGAIPWWQLWAGMLGTIFFAICVGALFDNYADPVRYAPATTT
jgi:alkylglycerol monooxygenase